MYQFGNTISVKLKNDRYDHVRATEAQTLFLSW
jgi:hypothetical protein